jgi:transposase
MGQERVELTSKQRIELIARHRREKSSRYADRIKTVLWRDEGVSFEEIAHRLFRDEDMVRHYEHVFLERGLDALLSDHFKTYDGKLERHQEEQLYDYVASHLFLDVSPIQAYVFEQFGVLYSASGMRELLHRIGFTYKNTSHAPGKADEARQRAFIAMLCELMRVKSPDAPVLFMDAVHPCYNSMPAYGWIAKGERLDISASTGRDRVNLNGALDAETHEVVIVECDSVNAQAAVALLEKIEARYRTAPVIHVFCDNAGYNHSNLVKEYLAHSRICLEYLPAYSPNLNLIERLWRFMHKHISYNRYYATFLEFRNELLMFFDRLSEEFADSLRSLLAFNFQVVSSRKRRAQVIA